MQCLASPYTLPCPTLAFTALLCHTLPCFSLPCFSLCFLYMFCLLLPSLHSPVLSCPVLSLVHSLFLTFLRVSSSYWPSVPFPFFSCPSFPFLILIPLAFVCVPYFRTALSSLSLRFSTLPCPHLFSLRSPFSFYFVWPSLFTLLPSSALRGDWWLSGQPTRNLKQPHSA